MDLQLKFHNHIIDRDEYKRSYRDLHITKHSLIHLKMYLGFSGADKTPAITVKSNGGQKRAAEPLSQSTQVFNLMQYYKTILILFTSKLLFIT